MVLTILLFIAAATLHSGHSLLGVNVEVGPRWGASKTLPIAYKIKCVPTGLADKAIELVSLELQKQGQVSSIVALKQSQNKRKPNNMVIDMNTKYQAAGSLDIKNSYLEVTVLNPTNSDGGNYNCIVNYMNTEGNLDTLVGNGHLDVNIFIFTNSLTGTQSRLAILEEKLKTKTAKDALAEKRIDDLVNTVDNLKGKINAVSAFSASCNDDLYQLVEGNAMKFDSVITNIGQEGYNKGTGIFTAPITGIYSFHLAVTSKIATTGKTLHFYLKVNKSKTLANLIVGDVRFADESSVSSVVKLNAGDMVIAEIGRVPKGVRFTRGEWTVFSGYLVHAM